MNITELYVALILGVIVSLAFEELFGISTGGMISPGIIAMHLGSPDIILYILLSSVVTYLIVDKVLGKYLILYGKRMFALMVTVGLLLKLTGEYFHAFLPFAVVGFRGVGAIVPSLMANTYSRPGIVYTLGGTIIASGIVYLCLQLVYMV